jgi:cytochrome c553
MTFSLRTTASLAAGLLLGAAGCAEPTQEEERLARGAEIFTYCTQCHGDDGNGRQQYGAPGIAGLDAWYVEAQVKKFRLGARGDHPDDHEGLRMRPMSRTLANDSEVQLVAQYIAGLPRLRGPQTVNGHAERGRVLYEPCVQCHGERAEGRRDLNAPPLAGSDDWYLVTQLGKFRRGVRGADPQDATGSQMRGMVATLPDEEADRDVVAYIRSLSPQWQE